MKKISSLLCLLISIGAFAQKQLPSRLIVLTFDDAPKSHYSYVGPLLKKYGFGATFYVCEFPPDYPDTTKYMSWPEIQQLSRWGFEIGNHTWHHVNVSHVNAEKLQEELAYIEHKCDSLGIPKPTSFAYPGYATGGSATEVLHRMGYLSARIGDDRPYDPGKDDPYFIPSYTMKADNEPLIRKALAEADSGRIVILTIHGVPDIAHEWVTTPPALFASYMQWLHDHHFTVVSMRTLFKLLKKAGKLK